MLPSDSMTKTLAARNVLANASEENTGPVSYGLTTNHYYSNSTGGWATVVTLAPGDSDNVASKEKLSLPNDLAARVLLRNSRIRQGLSLDAPLYFPGRETMAFFRVTNVSADEIDLICSKGISQIVFEQVRGEVERRMCEGALALMAIFAAIITMVNINAGILTRDVSYMMVIVINLVIVGAFSLLVGLIAWVQEVVADCCSHSDWGCRFLECRIFGCLGPICSPRPVPVIYH